MVFYLSVCATSLIGCNISNQARLGPKVKRLIFTSLFGSISNFKNERANLFKAGCGCHTQPGRSNKIGGSTLNIKMAPNKKN